MILLPHLFVLQYLKKECQRLRGNPSELEFLLCGYNYCDIKDVYGEDYIAKAIQWFQNNEIFFMLGSRLDMDKLPSICVTYEGGSENEQFIGHDGGTRKVSIPARQYAKFSIKDLVNGDLLVSAAEKIKTKVWRNLVVKNGKFSAKITDILPSGDDDILVLSKKASLDKVSLQDWSAESFVVSKTRHIGSSMDSVTVNVYLTIQGDPELAEMVSTIIRYLLKQAHLYLESRGLYESRMSHSALSRSADFDESQVWTVEFGINGTLQDMWIMSESTKGDKLDLDIVAKNGDNNEDEDVSVWQQQIQS